MDGGAFVFFFFFILVTSIGLRIAAGSWDRSRIQEHLAARGARAEKIEWAPFGRGWFGEKGDRIYNVTYHDARGRRRQASCKTSMFSGVYWTHDEGGDPELGSPGPSSQGVDEVRRLRKENEMLRQQLSERR